MPTDAELIARFTDVLPGQEVMAERLLQRWSEPHRHYHDVAHLAAVLDRIDELAGPEADLFVVRLAAWFHDAVYDVPERELTNEEASARLAIRELGRVGLEQEDLNEVARLVRLTADHRPGSRDPNGALLSDADLAVLAGTPEEYAAYVAAVRAEHPRSSDEEFDRGRLSILLGLGSGGLFRTGKGNRLHKRARANLDAEIATLAERLGIDLDDPEALPGRPAGVERSSG